MHVGTLTPELLRQNCQSLGLDGGPGCLEALRVPGQFKARSLLLKLLHNEIFIHVKMQEAFQLHDNVYVHQKRYLSLGSLFSMNQLCNGY